MQTSGEAIGTSAGAVTVFEIQRTVNGEGYMKCGGKWVGWSRVWPDTEGLNRAKHLRSVLLVVFIPFLTPLGSCFWPFTSTREKSLLADDTCSSPKYVRWILGKRSIANSRSSSACHYRHLVGHTFVTPISRMSQRLLRCGPGGAD